ncbi:MAG: hypothetical protein ACYTGL_24820 [Planctomycetota bacterium]
MKKSDLSRRDFNRFALTALGGVAAGSVVGCSDAGSGGGGAAAPDAGTTTPDSAGAEVPEPGDVAEAGEASAAQADKHVCRGLNTCKGMGAGGENDCAGMGACATAAAHECATHNECKGQGGCGEKPGENACKGMGGCAVPLKEHAWSTARSNFEAAMKADGKEFGDAPAAG